MFIYRVPATRVLLLQIDAIASEPLALGELRLVFAAGERSAVRPLSAARIAGWTRG